MLAVFLLACGPKIKKEKKKKQRQLRRKGRGRRKERKRMADEGREKDEQDHLKMNNSTGSNNHLRTIDLFRPKIIQNNRSKVCDDRCQNEARM